MITKKKIQTIRPRRSTQGNLSLSIENSNQILQIERFLIDCGKTKTKVIRTVN